MQLSSLTRVIFFIGCLGASVACAQQRSEYIKVEVKGTLKTGILAIGAETTGTTITVAPKGSPAVVWELDFGRNEQLSDQAKKFHGQLVVVEGTYFQKKGIEIGIRHIVTVTSLESAAPKVDLAALRQHWVHSYEEQKKASSGQIFRPSGSRKFPPSRFRMAYHFEPNGKCKWMYLSPSDRHHFKSGSWALNPKDKSLLEITKQSKETYRIVELSKDILRLAPVKAKR